MIRLSVNDYCQDCPEFEAEVLKGRMFYGFTEGADTIIRCKHYIKCQKIEKYLLERLKYREKTDGKEEN